MFPFALTVGLSPAQRHSLAEGLQTLGEHPAVAHLYVADEPGVVRSVIFVRDESPESAQAVVDDLVAQLAEVVPSCLDVEVHPITPDMPPGEPD